jgi:SAM-dependent methyltransferase
MTMIDEWNPKTLLETSVYYWKSCALQAGVKLGVFTVIGDRSLTGSEIASTINGDQRSVPMLLNALAAMNLLDKSGDSFANTDSSKKFLSRDSEYYIGYMINHHHHLMASWARLDLAVKTGEPQRSRASFSDEEKRESFLMGMFVMAMGTAPAAAEEIDLSDCRHLLDLGGGPGTYAIHFCLKNPDLKATIFDLPTTRPFAEKTIARFGLQDRIDFVDGNYLEDEISGTFDVAWLSHILHGESPEAATGIVQKAASSLSPGGMIFIHEFILNNTLDGPLSPALFSLNMLLGTPSGQAYSEKQLMGMLQKFGGSDIRRLPFRGPADSGIIAGIVS